MIGSGIFLLPGEAAGVIGPAAVLALGLAGVFSLLVALCFADAGSRFEGTGAAYIYAEAAFGRFVGFQIGWISWAVRLISWAALANGFALALAAAVGHDREDVIWIRAVALTALVVLSVANVLGARTGARVIKLFTVAKLIPLALFLGLGVAFIQPGRFEPFAPHGWSGFGETTLLVLWAFAGFEQTAVPAGEVRNPQRAVPAGLLTVMSLVLGLYIATFLVAQGTHPSLAGSKAPIAEAAATFMGPTGAALIAFGIALSVLGTTSGTALTAPRMLYALAERGQIPAFWGRVHARWGSPVPAIVATLAISGALAITGTFKQLVIISVVARFAQYIATCLAVVVFQRRDRTPAARGLFRVPGGPVIPVLTALLCVGLMTQAPLPRLLAGVPPSCRGFPCTLCSAAFCEPRPRPRPSPAFIHPSSGSWMACAPSDS